MVKLPNFIYRILALAKLIILDGLRRHALIGLVLFALAGCTGGLLFFDFIPREIGRASNDFIFSILWLTGLIFLLFHAVQVTAWDNERGGLHIYLARPLSRTEYCVALFVGLAFLLLLLDLVLGGLGILILSFIKNSVAEIYFPLLSLPFYLLALVGLYCIQLTILAAILVFSSVIRGSFPVLLLAICYYFICTGLPVVRESLQQKSEGESFWPDYLLQGLTAVFPDFSRLDFKTLAVTADNVLIASQLFLPFATTALYIVLLLWLACSIYTRRDLQ